MQETSSSTQMPQASIVPSPAAAYHPSSFPNAEANDGTLPVAEAPQENAAAPSASVESNASKYLGDAPCAAPESLQCLGALPTGANGNGGNGPTTGLVVGIILALFMLAAAVLMLGCWWRQRRRECNCMQVKSCFNFQVHSSHASNFVASLHEAAA
jgi:hypothetical protein